MDIPTPKVFKYRNNDAILTVGYDISGRLFSSITKNGKTVAQDMYIKFPAEVQLQKYGWIRYYE